MALRLFPEDVRRIDSLRTQASATVSARHVLVCFVLIDSAESAPPDAAGVEVTDAPGVWPYLPLAGYTWSGRWTDPGHAIIWKGRETSTGVEQWDDGTEWSVNQGAG